MAGCISQAPQYGTMAAPAWVEKGNGAFNDGGQGIFYGVGITQGIRNRALAVVAADDRARAEIAKVMNSYIAVLTRDYMASTAAGGMGSSGEEQRVSQTLSNFAKLTLHGAVIVDHWRDSSDGTLFSLCRLDMDAVRRTLADAERLDLGLRDFVRDRGEASFNKMLPGGAPPPPPAERAPEAPKPQAEPVPWWREK